MSTPLHLEASLRAAREGRERLQSADGSAFWEHQFAKMVPVAPEDPREADAIHAANLAALSPAEYEQQRASLGISPEAGAFGEVRPDLAALRKAAALVRPQAPEAVTAASIIPPGTSEFGRGAVAANPRRHPSPWVSTD